MRSFEAMSVLRAGVMIVATLRRSVSVLVLPRTKRAVARGCRNSAGTGQ